MDKVLLNVKETTKYLGLGETKTRELMRSESWSMRIGNRWYANKTLLDKWLACQCEDKYHKHN